MSSKEITAAEIDGLYERLSRRADSTGYHLNSDTKYAKELIESLLINQNRYGYWACPCRLASGNRDDDRDIICPCTYRDPDLAEYEQCYCGLYVSGSIQRGEKKAGSIPERRPLPTE